MKQNERIIKSLNKPSLSSAMKNTQSSLNKPSMTLKPTSKGTTPKQK